MFELNRKMNEEKIKEIGDNHLATSAENPMRADAFDISDTEKIEKIQESVKDILQTLGMDLTDDSLQGTPKRVAKAFVNEIFMGLNPANLPKASTFENNYNYGEMLVEKNIVVYSTCEHHLLPIIGRAHVAYISSGKVIGISKLNRIVQYYAKRPQVQERLTNQIAEDLKAILQTEDVAVIIDAKHLCVSSRGVKDDTSSTVTTYYGGAFNNAAKIVELQNYLN